jgi:hypothetical protein
VRDKEVGDFQVKPVDRLVIELVVDRCLKR